jgi:O-acetyl-ADP-ribose deacetylase (regulator of RNase III)
LSLFTVRTTDYKLNNTIFRVTYGDITRSRMDAIVSSDDNFLSMGGGVSEAILSAGGDTIREEARKHVPLEVGDVAVTSAGNLPAKYVFHAVTLDYEKMIHQSEQTLKRAILKCLKLADTLGVHTISFPALGTGVCGFPFELAAEVMTSTIADYLIGETQIELVVLTLFAREIVSESDLNLFYEKSVGKASVYTQSKRMGSLIAELKTLVDQMKVPVLSTRIAELQTQLVAAQRSLAVKINPEDSSTYKTTEMEAVSKEVVKMSTQVQEYPDWEVKQLEATVLKTKLSGLLTQVNVQYAQRNKFVEEKAKFGTIGVPPRLENAIVDIDKEIYDTEARIVEVRKQIAPFL